MGWQNYNIHFLKKRQTKRSLNRLSLSPNEKARTWRTPSRSRVKDVISDFYMQNGFRIRANCFIKMNL
jgi:hypothetical protein